jgi:hypothetical protein
VRSSSKSLNLLLDLATRLVCFWTPLQSTGTHIKVMVYTSKKFLQIRIEP